MVTWDDFEKIWASTSPLTPYEFSDPNYSQGWNFVGSTPPARQMWDSIQKKNDEKFKYLRDNFGTPHIVTQASDMTDTDMVYVYMGSEAGWNNGHWYYYNEGTSSWEDGGVYNSVAFVTDTTLSIAGQPADAKATGDALALKADLAGCTFTGNVSVNADFSVTGDSTLTGNVSASGDVNATGGVTADNISATTNGTIGGALSVAGSSTLTGNVSAGADVTVVGDVSSANIIASNNANIGGNATVTGSVASASLTTTADGTIGGNLSVSGTTTLTGDAVASADLSVAGDSALTKLSVSGTTALAGTSTAPTPSADDNSTKIATTEYVQTEIKPIETDVTINDKRITNIEKLLQGNLYDYQTDNSSAYTKSVPAGALPYAGLEKVGGKTVVMNQLVKNGNFADTSEWYGSGCSLSVSNNVGTITVTNDEYTTYLSQTRDYVNAHTFYLAANLTNNLSNANVSLNMYGVDTVVNQVNSPVASGNTAWSRRIVKGGAETAHNIRVFVSGTRANGETIIVSNFICIDLTLMFGAGNEPSTVEEFEAMFPADYYAYNEGTLLSAGVTEVESDSINVWDEEWENGYYDRTTGNKGGNSDTTYFRCKNYIPVLPNTAYYFKMPSAHASNTSYFGVLYYDADKNYLGNSTDLATNHIKTMGANVRYITFYVEVGTSGATYQHDICINVSNSSINGTYRPHILATYPIPASIQALEGYGWSAGTAYNYIDFERKVFVQNVGRVIFDGTQPMVTQSISSTVCRVNYAADNVKPFTDTSNVDDKIVSSYLDASSNSITYQGGRGILRRANGDSNITVSLGTESGITTSSAFSDYLTAHPLTVYYALATPVETDISAYLTDDNLISVESGGTLTFPNSNGDDYQIPVPSEETYMIDMQEAINNG